MLGRTNFRSWVITLVVTLSTATALFAAPASAKSTTKTVTGPTGQTLTLSNTSVSDGQVVTATGNNYDKKIGIYLAFCVVNAKGVKPEPCGGGVNTSGVSSSSVWISSNPPTYGKSLAIAFSKTGGFKQSLAVSRHIGDLDCATVKCAVVTRADHTRTSYRKADVIIPVTFKK
jgi:hypothetical protein